MALGSAAARRRRLATCAVRRSMLLSAAAKVDLGLTREIGVGTTEPRHLSFLLDSEEAQEPDWPEHSVEARIASAQQLALQRKQYDGDALAWLAGEPEETRSRNTHGSPTAFPAPSISASAPKHPTQAVGASWGPLTATTASLPTTSEPTIAQTQALPEEVRSGLSVDSTSCMEREGRPSVESLAEVKPAAEASCASTCCKTRRGRHTSVGPPTSRSCDAYEDINSSNEAGRQDCPSVESLAEVSPNVEVGSSSASTQRTGRRSKDRPPGEPPTEASPCEVRSSTSDSNKGEGRKGCPVESLAEVSPGRMEHPPEDFGQHESLLNSLRRSLGCEVRLWRAPPQVAARPTELANQLRSVLSEAMDLLQLMPIGRTGHVLESLCSHTVDLLEAEPDERDEEWSIAALETLQSAGEFLAITKFSRPL